MKFTMLTIINYHGIFYLGNELMNEYALLIIGIVLYERFRNEKVWNDFYNTPSPTLPDDSVNTQEQLSVQIGEFVLRKSWKYDIDANMINAIIMTESSFRPNIITPETLNRNSYGLMQLLDSTARWMGFTGDLSGLLDIELNLDFGTKYLKYQLDRYNGDYEKAVAAYNAGSVRYDSVGNYINKEYVIKVFRYYNQFKGSDLYYG